MTNFLKKISAWERWNFFVLYAPIAPVWLWYCLRSRSLWFFSASNPTITFGGFEGEGKKEMYEQLPAEMVPRSIYITAGMPADVLLNKIAVEGFSYPFIVKPDVGMKGILFRVIGDRTQLLRYHERIPVEYIVQQKVDLPVEVSVFYYRYPWQQQGHITGFIQKELLQVTGDGQHCLKELILSHPRARLRFEEMEHRHGHRFDRILEKDEVFYLSYAGNHNRGAHFINLNTEIDERLLEVFDRISHYTGTFYYGRYDIKTTSVADLKAGRNFQILEFNGAGAEPNHIYDSGMSLWQAYRVILRHWKVLFKISRYNHRHGSPYWAYRKGKDFLQSARKHFRMLEQYD
ncbi:D-alanine--D-alanine ligase [Niabella terrae]